MAGEVTVRRAVWKHLMDDPTIRALVGDRIEYRRRPDGMAFPCLIVTVVDHVPRHDLDGRAWTESRITVTAMAETEATAEAVASTVEQSLDGFSGSMAGLHVMSCRVTNSLPVYQEETGHTHHHVDLIIEHKGGVDSG